MSCAPSIAATRRLRRLETNNRRRARLKGCDAKTVDFLAQLERQDWRCWICGDAMDPEVSPADPMSISLEHAIALACGGGHVTENVRGAHQGCNIEKGQTKDGPLAAKIKRQAGLKGQQARRAAGKTRSIPQRANPWPPKGSRKLQSRGFS